MDSFHGALISLSQTNHLILNLLTTFSRVTQRKDLQQQSPDSGRFEGQHKTVD